MSETDPTPVGNWIKDQFGIRSAITAVFMIHAVLNESSQILNHYLDRSPEHGTKDTAEHVPVTLKHFKLLARLGKAPVCEPKQYCAISVRHLIRGLSQPWLLFTEIENGAEFFFSEEDYLTAEQVVKETMTRRVKGQTMTKTSKGWRTAGKKSGKTRVKAETPPTTTLGAPSSSYIFVDGIGGPLSMSPVPPPSSSSNSGPSSSVASISSTTPLEPPVPKKVTTSPSRNKKRPRRFAASTVKSYLVPDSDDETILDEHKPDSMSLAKSKEAGKRKAESNLQRWIKHLTALQKEELKRVSNRGLNPSFLDSELYCFSTTRRKNVWRGWSWASRG